MRIALLCSEYFHYRLEGGRQIPTQSHGGFGYLTRKKAEGFAKKGHDVHVLVPAPHFDSTAEAVSEIHLGGVTVHPYSATKPSGLGGLSPLLSSVERGIIAVTGGRIPALESLIRRVDAEIYVSENPSLASSSVPQSYLHVLIFHDPWGLSDVLTLQRAAHDYTRIAGVRSLPLSPVSGSALPWYDELTNVTGTLLLRRLTRSIPPAHMFAEAECTAKKASELYRLKSLPGILPNPVDVPSTPGIKAETPTICWIGRWDPQKRVDLLLKAASNLPEIEFYVIGSPTVRPDLLEAAAVMESRYSRYPNIHLMRFVSEEEKARVLDQSWYLLNTSCREGLPTSFLEAWAHGTAVIAPVDPDGYVSRFGRYVADGNYQKAIQDCVRSEGYRTMGPAGHAFVRDTFRTDEVVRRHLEVFTQLTSAAK